jgi:uncharacterized protein
MELQFEWDPPKAERNLALHGVTLEEAATAFGDPLSVTIDDPLHSVDEDRYRSAGPIEAASWSSYTRTGAAGSGS